MPRDKNNYGLSFEEACRELAGRVADGLERDDLQRAKREVAREYSLDRFPSNPEVLEVAESLSGDGAREVLRKKPSRTLSGVSVVAVMTSPAECPHGRCAMCPGGPDDGTPQSYTGKEPAARRGLSSGYGPHKQVESRIEQLEASGHPADKVELIIMGGTFTAREGTYRENFVKRCLDALNGGESPTLQRAKEVNETADRRCVGMTLETRPDEITEKRGKAALHKGFTRVELGAQTLKEEALDLMNRGHTVADLKRATENLKDLGFKVTYHWMPGLPGVDPREELEVFEDLFEEPFMPDALKVYPTLVLEGTELFEAWRRGDYSPMDDAECADVTASLLERTPPWVRVKRVMRDIPSGEIAAGPRSTNMRQMAWRELEDRGSNCRCVRCREVGRNEAEVDPEDLDLIHRTYRASGGRENFLSFEAPGEDVLVALLRLREPGEPPEPFESAALVREVHVYGDEVPIGQSSENSWQHSSLGERLMERAEGIASSRGYDELCVISGIGAREYYRGLGFELKGPYMAKNL